MYRITDFFNVTDPMCFRIKVLEDKMKIHVGFTRSKPLSVDTDQDLLNPSISMQEKLELPK